MRRFLFLFVLFAPAAHGAHTLESVTVNPNPAAFSGDKAPEVQVTVTVKRANTGPASCEASVDFGDGARPRPEDYGMSSSRSFHHTYAKGGTYTVSVKGSGKTPCAGTAQASLTVTGKPAAKKAAEKKSPEKKPEAKKKPEPKKKAEPKKKPEPKKKGAEAPFPGKSPNP